jgi:hypothetical protein
MTETTLLEPSFADVGTAIERSVALPARIRSHWLCSLRQIAKALDKPMEAILARWTAARFGGHAARRSIARAWNDCVGSSKAGPRAGSSSPRSRRKKGRHGRSFRRA